LASARITQAGASFGNATFWQTPLEQICPFWHLESVSTQALPLELQTLQPFAKPGVQNWTAVQVIAIELAFELDTPSNTLFPDGKSSP